MGVGATAADMANLYSRTKAMGYSDNGELGCVFGCHVPSGSRQYSNEYVAHNLGPNITLRIDAAKTAMQNVIADAKRASNGINSIQFAIYTMQQDPSTGIVLNTVAPLSSNYSSLSQAISAIELGNNNGWVGYGDSNLSSSLSQFASAVWSTAPSGDGSAAATPLNVVFIITDGVQDTTGWWCFWTHCTGPFDPSNCTPLKSKATVGVIYTTYLPVYNNNDPAQGLEYGYANMVAPFAAQIAPNLQACASNSQYYYEATDGPALDKAMATLFASTYSTLQVMQ